MTINLTVQVEQKTLDIIKELFCFWISFHDYPTVLTFDQGHTQFIYDLFAH